MDVPARLVAAAEELIARNGVEAVSLREITTRAQVGNASAVQYHFGDREGLLRAILRKHHPQVEARRNVLLDAYQAAGHPDARTLVAAYVRPLAAELDEGDGGPGYLQLLADLLNRPNPPFRGAADDRDPTNSTDRWRHLVAELLSPEALALHRRFVVMRFVTSELARRSDRPGGPGDTRLYVSHLIDLATAVLTAPVSPETARHVRLDRAPEPRRTKPT